MLLLRYLYSDVVVTVCVLGCCCYGMCTRMMLFQVGAPSPEDPAEEDSCAVSNHRHDLLHVALLQRWWDLGRGRLLLGLTLLMERDAQTRAGQTQVARRPNQVRKVVGGRGGGGRAPEASVLDLLY